MVTDLCTILLYDAEFNATLKWLGQIIMDRAELLNALAPEQYGSCIDHAAIYQSLNTSSLVSLHQCGSSLSAIG